MELNITKQKRTSAFTLLLISYVVIGKMFIPAENLFIFSNEFIAYGVGVVACVLLTRNYFKSKVFFAFAAYVIVLLLNYFTETLVNLGNVLSESFTIIVTACFGYYLFYESDNKVLSRLLLFLTTIIIIVYSVMTFVFYQNNPGIMRSAAMSYNYEIYRPLFLQGLAPYTFPHALSCLLPALVLGVKGKQQIRWKRWLSLVLLAASLVLIYITQATGALVVAVVAIFIAFIAKRGNVKKNIVTIGVVTVLMMPLMVSSSLQTVVLEWMGDAVGEESHYTGKIDELAESAAGVETEGDIQARGDLLGETLNAIIHHPILGVSDRSYGNHNALLDRWAEYGLVGFIPLLIGMFMMIRFTSRRLPNDIRIFYYIGVGANFLMMLTKSMFGWNQWFFFLVMLPLMVQFFGVTPKNNENVND